ncbi:SpnB-like Rossmann fold domain-containing protein [Actinomadura madurae]|uniref:SpnB-like Rossmann fold domain-containing protein n=1 Tax=Actinomadura madurae TaxID=1993 RepID=UPI0035587A9A
MEWRTLPPTEEPGGYADMQMAVLGDPLPHITAPRHATIEALAADDEVPPPDAVLMAAHSGAATAEAVRNAVVRTAERIREWLLDDRTAAIRLAVVTSGAVDGTAPGAAAVWGLVRSVQLEHPGRLILVDHDGTAESARALPAALAGGEPQIALRRGIAEVPRLTRAVRPPGGDDRVPDLRGGTVLITGAAGALGGLIARHLVRRHGARRLLLLGPARGRRPRCRRPPRRPHPCRCRGRVGGLRRR